MFTGSLVAIVTPMHADGGIDWGGWERLIALHLESGTAGIVVGGTTGESVALSDQELLELLARARALIGRRMALLAGAGMSATAGSVERARRLSAAGADALLVVTPAYNKPTQEGLYRHFEAVAGASSVPIVLYNVPGRTAVDLHPETVARLAKLPGIAGVKEAVPSIERIRELLALTGPGFCVLSGDDPTACEAMLSGARGVISVTANVAPRALSALSAAALHGERARAEQLDAPLQALHRALFVETSPIPVKWALTELGLIDRGLRLPLTELSEQHRPVVRAALQAATAAGPATARPERV